tara:strand:+ start:527 stop:1105 length:579 start_codon:yes stop_codon:yes gene_type:complete
MKYYSQCSQDRFVIDVLNNLNNIENGTFLDFGCWKPHEGNNTYVLEKKYSFTGISIDIDASVIPLWEHSDRNDKNFKLIDLSSANIKEILGNNYPNTKIIDYFSFDLEPPLLTLEVLQKIPFDEYRFKVVTYEHDGHRGFDTIKPSREIFTKNGYKRIKSDLMEQYWRNVSLAEDWWVLPDLIKIDKKYLDE